MVNPAVPPSNLPATISQGPLSSGSASPGPSPSLEGHRPQEVPVGEPGGVGDLVEGVDVVGLARACEAKEVAGPAGGPSQIEQLVDLVKEGVVGDVPDLVLLDLGRLGDRLVVGVEPLDRFGGQLRGGAGRDRQRQQTGQKKGCQQGAHQNSFSSEKPANTSSSSLRAMRSPNRKARSVRTLIPAP